MFKVDHPTLAPAECLYTHRADPEHGPYVDFNCDFTVVHQGRMYMAYTAVAEAAKTLDMPTPAEHEALRTELEAVTAERDELASKVERLEKFEESAKWTLEHLGRPVKKKPGRPRKKEPVS